MNKMTKISAVALGTLVFGTSVIAPTANVNTTKVSAAYVDDLLKDVQNKIDALKAAGTTEGTAQATALEYMVAHRSTWTADEAAAPAEAKAWNAPKDANGNLMLSAIDAIAKQAAANLSVAVPASTLKAPSTTTPATTTAATTTAATTTAATTTAATTPAATTTTAATTTAATTAAATTTAATTTASSTTVRGAGHVSNNVATIAFGGIALASLAVLAKKRNA